MDHRQEQRTYFAQLNHQTRFHWQVDDAFVRRHEYQALRPLVEEIRLLVRRKGHIRVLESGCGEGVNIAHLKQLGIQEQEVEIQGLDMSPEAVQVGKNLGMNLSVGDGLALPCTDQEFDLVFCRDVLHHLADDDARKKFFSEMCRVTKQDGVVVAIEPNPRNAGILALSYLIHAEQGLRQITQEHLLQLLPGGRVMSVAPSSVWRVLYHYRSPLYRCSWLALPTRLFLVVWDWLCKRGPQSMWSYRAYIWSVQK